MRSVASTAILLSFTCAAGALELPVELSTTIFEYNLEHPRQVWVADVDVSWDTTPAQRWGMAAEFRAGFLAMRLGYSADGKKTALVSILDDVTLGAPATRPYALPHCYKTSRVPGTISRAGSECKLPFEWQQGRVYSLRIGRIGRINSQAGDSGFVRWGGWITDSVTKAETMVGGFEVPNLPPYPYIEGYGPIRVTSTGAGISVQEAPADAGCASVPETSVTWSNPKQNYEHLPYSATAMYQSTPQGLPNPCGSTSAIYGKGGQSVTLTLNATVPYRLTELGNAFAPRPQVPVKDSGTDPLLSDRYSERIACTFQAVQNYFPQFFKGFTTSTRGATWYATGYPSDYAKANGVVERLFYNHAERNFYVRYAGAQDTLIGNIEFWVDSAGC